MFRVITGWWREHYNKIRPHSALGYRPPTPETITLNNPWTYLTDTEIFKLFQQAKRLKHPYNSPNDDDGV